jgi:glutamate--cysteine ligase
MSGPATAAETPITEKSQLIDHIARGERPDRAAWKIGVEHEKFGFDHRTLRPLPYDGPAGIRAMLDGLQRFGWMPVKEGEHTIALTMDGQSVSLEPGGQLELSGAPLDTLHQTCHELNSHLAQVKLVGEELGVGFLGLGFHPKVRRAEMPIMPKGRYNIMRAYMPKRGRLGLDMMLRTCTVQVNLDFASEADMAKKMRVSLALQPIATALFANSPFTEGVPNGFLSYRSQVWLDTDPDRTGMLPMAFEDGFGYERYVDWALDVPMYFVYRDGKYVDASGQSFRDFLAGRLPALPGQVPTLRDWADHLTTMFPEVRLKSYLEMRGADGGPWWRLCALPAFWVGLLYDQTALDAAWDLVKDWTVEERETLRNEVPKLALKTGFRNGTVRDIARQALAISAAGLTARNRLSAMGETEAHFLDSLQRTVDTGETPAEELLAHYHGKWQRNIDAVFGELAY